VTVIISGVFVPATTPFDPVTGDVDLVGFRENARTWFEAPLAGMVLFGSTGEGLLLDESERTRLLEGVRGVTPEGRLLLAGTGAESTRATIRLTRSAAAAGADAVLVQPPAFYRPQMTSAALRDHYVAVADAAPVPVILYQVPPAYSGVELVSGLVAELARHANIIGIKDSTGDLKAMGALVESCPAGFSILVGSGAVLYGALEVGACGGILAVATLAARQSCDVYRLKQAGDEAGAGRTQEMLAPLHRSVVAAHGVPGVKMAMDMLGLAGGPPRSPLQPLREKDQRLVREALARAGLLESSGGDR
jgi:4-hydroxy-2-oxoglutarate aldolase